MTTYFYNWEAYTEDAIGTASGGDWSLQEQSSSWTATVIDDSGNKQLVHKDGIASAWTVSVCDEAGATSGDIEAVCRFTYSAGTASVTRGPCLIQSDGQAYILHRASANTMQLWRVGTSGATAAALETTTLTFSDVSAGTYVWVRLGRSSGTIRAKIWTGLAADEPASWQLEDADTTLTSVKAGFGTYSYTADPWLCDLFGVGTAGDTAPTDSGANNAPTFDGTISNLTGTVGEPLTPVDVSAEFADLDSDPLTFSSVGTWPTRVGGGSWVSSAGVISGTPETGTEGTYTGLYVRASDGTDTVDSDELSFTVSAASGTAPVITSVSGSAIHGSSLSIIGTNLTDATVALKYSTVSVAQTVVAEADEITIASVSTTGLPYGDISLVVTVSGENATASINHAPVSTKGYSVVDVPWNEFSQSIFENGSAAVDGDQVEYVNTTSRSATALVRGDGTLRVGSGVGSHTFNVRLWDESALEWGAATAVTVTAYDYVPSSPTFDGPDLADLTPAVGELVEIDATALFSDSDNDIESYTLIGSWPSWITNTAGAISGFAEIGTWSSLSVRATDSGGRYTDSNLFGITCGISYSDVDRIAIENRGGSKTVNQRTGIELRARPFDSFGNAAYPSSLHWRLVDYNGSTLQDWTALDMTVTYDEYGGYSEVYADIEIDGALNTTSLNSQQNTVIVVADKDQRGEFSKTWNYTVKRVAGR